MKYLNGAELAGFIKERQAHQVRGLKQAHNIFPKLAIINCGLDAPSKKYTELKQKYGQDIGVEVELFNVSQSEAVDKIKSLNSDDSVHGIIVQLPLPDPSETDEIVNEINPAKDVDSLGKNSLYDPATPIAILWLLAGYNIDLPGKQIVIVGRGRLVGKPLLEIMNRSNLSPTTIDEFTENSNQIIANADVIVTAVGKPALITTDLVKRGAVVIDAGVASEKGVLKGDAHDELYEREDIKITPKIGGVGPLTITALFENVIKSASKPS